MKLLGNVGNCTVRIRPAVTEQRVPPPRLHHLLTLELGDDNFLVTLTRPRYDLAQRINHHALAGHVPFALATHVIARRQEYAVFEGPCGEEVLPRITDRRGVRRDDQLRSV